MKTRKIHILIVDDDKYFRMAIRDTLKEHAVFTEASSESTALELIERNHYDLALIDMDIDTGDSGIRVLKRSVSSKIHSIILSSQNDEEIIEKAYTNNCNHFLTKLHYKEHLESYIVRFIKNEINNNFEILFSQKFITQDQKLRSDIQNICNINLNNQSLAISGETGVGKSLIAELIHNQAIGESKPFIHINCSEISETLIESELFGHIKGSFTGASETKIGKLELANEGTIFLDEIATMPLIMQKKLLKALDQKSFYPVGSEKLVQSKFTIITATCEDLFEKIHNKEFRKDLYFRLTSLSLNIPPLRERPNDIPLITKSFLRSSARKFVIKEEAFTALKGLQLKGNTRELKHIISKLSGLHHGVILANDIENLMISAPNEQRSQENQLTQEQKSFIAHNGLREFIKKIEKETIKEALKRNEGKISHSIKELQISASAFYRILNEVVP